MKRSLFAWFIALACGSASAHPLHCEWLIRARGGQLELNPGAGVAMGSSGFGWLTGAEMQELLDAVAWEILELPDPHRVAFVASQFEGLSHEQIVRAYGASAAPGGQVVTAGRIGQIVATARGRLLWRLRNNPVFFRYYLDWRQEMNPGLDLDFEWWAGVILEYLG